MEPTTSDNSRNSQPTISAVLSDGTMIEMLSRPDDSWTGFCVRESEGWRISTEVDTPTERLVPYSPFNNLIRHEVVLFPSEPLEYGTEEELVSRIQGFIHAFVDVSPVFERIASYYVLLTWVYDDFNELPYLRVRGDYGSGKSRFLLTVGSICYKPIFASGASTVSPLFRIMDAFRGTLVMDESDFRFSDERAEVVKILNNGSSRGFPILRTEMTAKKEFDPRAYAVFGPKLIASRGLFEDRALESRCITEELGHFGLRPDIPINLPEGFKSQADELRNMLLLFRLRNQGRKRNMEPLADRSVEPRLNQVFAPLLSVIHDDGTREEIRRLVRGYDRQMAADRGMDAEAHVLEVIRDLLEEEQGGRLALKDITARMTGHYGQEYERRITIRWVGHLIRSRLHLKPQKSNGNFVLPPSEIPKLQRLFERYGLGASPDQAAFAGGELGDVGDDQQALGRLAEQPNPEPGT